MSIPSPFVQTRAESSSACRQTGFAGLFPPLPVCGATVFVLPVEQRKPNRFADNSNILSESERERCARLAFDHDRRQYCAAKSLLRRALGQYLGVAPERVEFNVGPHGRPRLVRPSQLDFNVSHCLGAVAVAVARRAQIGVDIESLATPAPDYRDVARSCFAASEIEWIDRAPKPESHARFIELWTLKEAGLKALGCGLRRRLDELEFEFAGALALQMVGTADPQGRNWRFELHEIAPDLRLSFALAASIDGHAEAQLWHVGAADGSLRLAARAQRQGRAGAPTSILPN